MKRHLNHAHSFQHTFLRFSEITDGLVVFTDVNRLYLRINPMNPTLMKQDEKEQLIEELGMLIQSVDQAFEIGLHVTDRQADITSNVSMLKQMHEQAENSYVQAYIEEQLEALQNENEIGTERYFYITLSYRKHISFEDIKTEAHQLSQLGFKFHLQVMKKTEIMRIFAIYTVRHFDAIPVSCENECSRFKDVMTPIRARFFPTYAQIGDMFVKTHVIRQYPEQANKLLLFEHLCKLNGVEITIRLNQLDDAKISEGIDKTINASKQTQAMAYKETEKMASQKKQSDLGRMYERMLMEHESMYYLSIYIQIKAFDLDGLKLLEKQVQRELLAIGFVKETPQLLQREAWFGCAPFGDNSLKAYIARNVPLSTTACIMPFVYSGRKDLYGQMIGNDYAGGQMLVDFEQKSDEVANTNIAIIGESGQGKTRLEHLIMFQKYLRGNRLFIEDPEREHYSFVEKLGGTYIRPGGEYIINPLEIFPHASEDVGGIEKSVSLLRQHISWVCDFFQVYNREINADLLSILLERFYISCGLTFIDQNVNDVVESPILSDFYTYIEGVLQTPQNEQDTVLYTASQLSQLLQQIYGICVGNDADLCNGQTRIEDNQVIAWDLNDLLAGSKRRLHIVQHLISGYVWSQVVRERYQKKVTYVISELSLRLNKDQMQSIVATIAMLKRFRKYESDMIISTQNPYDMMREGLKEYTTALFTSPSFRFLFYPGDGDRQEFMKVVNITETEYQTIAKSKRGNVLFMAGATKYNIQIVPPSEVELQLYGRGGGL